jgi:hypothetical protein
MGDLATPEALILRWEEVLRDPSLQDLPYKIELNAWGKIEMSPASNRHGRLQAAISAEFVRQLPDGIAISECSILTRIGIRAPDVVWASAAFMKAYGEITRLILAWALPRSGSSRSREAFAISVQPGKRRAASFRSQ